MIQEKLIQEILAKPFMLKLTQHVQQRLPKTMVSDFVLVVETQTDALFEVDVASLIPGQAEQKHEREDREQAAAMTTDEAMDEHALPAYQRLHQELQHCPHPLLPIPAIEAASVIDVQPPPPAILGVRVVDVGHVDDAMCIVSCPPDGIFMRADIKRTSVGLTEDEPRHRRNSRTPAMQQVVARSPELQNLEQKKQMLPSGTLEP